MCHDCNLRCEYCMPADGLPLRGKPMSVDELEAVARAAALCGINKVRLTGGEPLTRPEIVEICERIGHVEGIQSLCITTNGTRLAELAEALRAAGVTRINLSLDSLSPQRYAQITRGGDLAQVLRGMEAVLAAGFERLKINCVLIGGVNDDEVGDFVRLTLNHALEVRFIELMPMGECAGWPKERFISAETVLKTCPELQPIGSEGVAQRYRLPNSQGAVGLIRPMSHAFCGDCDRIRVTSDGMLKPCLHSGAELSLRGLTGEALLQRMSDGIEGKPSTHHLLNGGSETERRMSQIGG
ncbi:MAG: GTP 3',8-cyclase MoaA [Clostridia bacterium]|nr:GTP 3',8-cyclase MoaA [Clostridia bacterium]